MRVIVTGGTGLIGSLLTQDLAADGHEVIVLSRKPGKHAAALPRGVQVVGWDARTAQGWGQLADGADVIVNLAGESLSGVHFIPDRWTKEKKRRIRESRLNAGKAVVEAIEAASQKPKVLIQASAVGYYGPSREKRFTEDDPPGQDFLAQICVQWEASTAPIEAMGVRRVIIRSGVSMTTEGSALPRLLLPYRLFVGGPFGDGKQWLSWVHHHDLTLAIRFLIEDADASGAFNIAAPNPVTNAEFGRILGKVINRPSWLPAPGFAMRLALGEVASFVLNGQFVIPERLKESGFGFRFPDLESALRDILR